MRRSQAKFIRKNRGVSYKFYKLEIHPIENAPDNQSAWLSIQGGIFFDFQLNGIKADLIKDGFRVLII